MACIGFRMLKPEFRNSYNFLPQLGLEEASSAKDKSESNLCIWSFSSLEGEFLFFAFEKALGIYPWQRSSIDFIGLRS